MGLQSEIWQWVELMPGWQSDLVRRLCSQQSLDEAGLDEVRAMLLEANGIEDSAKPAPKPIRAQCADIPQDASAQGSARILELRDLKGVGAVRADQSLSFSRDGLTIVYGANGAGKSSYARVLKQACRATDNNAKILPNVFQAGSVTGQAVIQYEESGTTKSLDRIVNTSPEPDLSTVSVFDAGTARLYTTESNEVAYIPTALSIFDRLARTQNELRSGLQVLIADLEKVKLSMSEFPPNTKVWEVLTKLSTKTKAEEIKKLATLSPNEEQELAKVADQVAGMQRAQSDAQELRRRVSEVKQLRLQVVSVGTVVDDSGMAGLKEADLKEQEAIEAARLASAEFTAEPLPGVGTSPWRILWKAARDFSISAYPGNDFPVVTDDARCVLCQQPLDVEARTRFVRFEAYVQNVVSATAEAATSTRQVAASMLETAPIQAGMDAAVLKYIRDVDEPLAKLLDAFFASATARLVAARKALVGHDWESIPPLASAPLGAIDQWITSQEQKVADLEALATPEKQVEVQQRFSELKARQQLQDRVADVLEHVERLRRIALLQKASKDLLTTSITAKMNDLTGKVVTANLRQHLTDELKALTCDSLQVKMVSRGSKGKSLIYLQLVSAGEHENVPVTQVLSEGEQRAVALAFFLAEIGAAGHDGGMIFDDPVSSLDHERRDTVAGRLVRAAKQRQVIVFTHDLNFLFALKHAAEAQGVTCQSRWIRSQPGMVGLTDSEEPWLARDVKGRLAYLKNELVRLKKLRDSGDAKYQMEAKQWVALLREAWERLVEERLFNRTVMRFDLAVQTQRLEKVKNRITPDIIDQITAAMTETSKWVHDQAPAINRQPPEPDQLTQELGKLEEMVKDKLPAV